MTGEVTVNDFGSTGDGATDNSSAFLSAIESLAPSEAGVGGTVLVPAGVFFFSDDLHINRPIVLQGAAGGGGNGATTLKFAAGKGIVVDRYNTSLDGGRGDNSCLCDLDIVSTMLPLAIWAPGAAYAVGDCVRPPGDNRYYHECVQAGHSGDAQPDWAQIPGTVTIDGGAEWLCHIHAGVWMRARARLSNVYLYGFSNAGVHIQASYAYHPPTNANDWYLDKLQIQSCGVGVAAIGDDTSSGIAVAVQCLQIGYQLDGTPIPGHGGHGFHDHSFLGNTYQTCHVEVATGRAYLADGANARNTFLGCYAESTQPIKISYPSTWISGFPGPGFTDDSSALILGPDITSPLTIANRRGTYRVNSQVGVDDSTMTELAFGSSDDQSFGLRLQYDGAGRHRLVWANSPVYQAFSVTAARSLPGPGVMAFPKLLLGSQGSTERVLTYAAARPTTGFWTRGDRVYTSAPSVGGPEGWVCIASGGWATPWSARSELRIGTLATPSVPNDRVYRVVGLPGSSTYSGITGAVEPTWPESLGGTVTDGTILWSCDGVDASSGSQIFATFGSITS